MYDHGFIPTRIGHVYFASIAVLKSIVSSEYVNERPNHLVRSRGLFGSTPTLSYRGPCLPGAPPLILSPSQWTKLLVGLTATWFLAYSWLSFVWESLPTWSALLTCNAPIPTSRDTAPWRNIPVHPMLEHIPMTWDPLAVQILMTSEIWFIRMFTKWMRTWTMTLTLP